MRLGYIGIQRRRGRDRPNIDVIAEVAPTLRMIEAPVVPARASVRNEPDRAIAAEVEGSMIRSQGVVRRLICSRLYRRRRNGSAPHVPSPRRFCARQKR